MTGMIGTACSATQEHIVPSRQNHRFLVGDSPPKSRQPAGMVSVRDKDSLSKIALARFREVLDQMGWTEEWAITRLWEEAGAELGLKSKKAVEQWFNPERGMAIPAIFTVSSIFGIDAGWLAGQQHATQPLIRNGLAFRDIEMAKKKQGAEMQKKPRKRRA